MKLLFVCTGNTCRSCMAEAIAKSEAEKLNIDIEISSAGVHAFKGDGASKNAVIVMQEMGIDLSCHIARPVTKQIIEDSDLILTMTNSHKDMLLSIFPSSEGKVFTIMEYAGLDGDVVDPFGGDVEIYRNCAKQLKYLIDRILDKIRKDRAL
ncbi:low molecular weight protein arginine phosphatase [Caloramator sp. E03]|uniref:low molecular weight protein arginine phosphatase n=1 Tax=Caloramator sp. E03 TaxID=2576307 RepID=UPI001110D56E|nr:low molecular weight protein arginine phosphatase [Caloramator sp. E03]QCX33383.1 low molecular weight protein arginine phosphatase [Caloramator sp. E03]